ncbi:P-loop containing nucleoside triphosphate hydrolase protein, partial [Hysterangium stoloniferum]
AYARQRRNLLDILNRLHSTGVQKDIDLPQIVVIGSQSVGKSSLIESMSGVTLPRDTGTCTRCPLECRLEYSTKNWSCRVFLRFERDTQGNALEKVQEYEFGPVITDKSEVAAILRRAQRAILRPALDHNLFLQDKDLAIKECPPLSFSSNCVCMRITGPDVPDLYFFDLPGVIANVRDGGNINDIELVRNLTNTYISRPSCLILLVVSCETDFENQGAGRLALEVDPEGHRIVGVLTKPDRIETATGEKWAAVLRNEENRLTNGWFCVKQPDPTELRQNVTWEDARLREDLFFTHQEPWKSLAERHRRRLGSMNLIRFLSRSLSKLIAVRLPEVEKELTISLDDINWRLNELPPPKFEDPSSELVGLIFDFSAAVSRDVKGKARLDDTMQSLLHGIRIAQIRLRSSVVRTAPRFCPWSRQDTPPGSPNSTISMSSVGAPLPWVSEPTFLTKEEQIPFDDRTGKIMYLDEVMEFAEHSVTRELPGDFPSFAVKEELIKVSLKGWGTPMLEYFESVHNLMNQHMKTLVDIHFGIHMHSGLHARVMSIVREQLRMLHQKTLQRLDALLSVEGLPFTLNHTYLKEYKDKFLAHYKVIRRRSKGQDTIVRRFNDSGGIVSTQVRNDLVDLTDLLQRFGLPCTPNDLYRLLPDDEFEPALDVIATVRAYFQVAFRRFIDQVPLEVDAGFVRSFDKTIRNALVVGLDVKSPERCSLWLQDSPEVMGRRRELMATKQRLEAARVELSSFVLT